MFLDFFYRLRRAEIPVSITEFLVMLEGLDRQVCDFNLDHFYHFSRTTLVKDERHYDRFDRVFADTMSGIEHLFGSLEIDLPVEWLQKQAELLLSEEEKKLVESRGGWKQLMEELKKRLEEQQSRHQGGNKWIGTAGRSPYGAYGYNPAGVRIGQDQSRQRRAVKVWDQRSFRNLDDSVELGTRNIKLALRKLRKLTREGIAEELDLDGTIQHTARNAGYLDLRMRPEHHNNIKVLIFFDIGGSMDDHIKICEEMFSAAHSEFKHLEYFYFHNCLYETAWKDNHRRFRERIPTMDILHTYNRDYKLVFVGDATMSPWEIIYPGGSVEHMNDESGQVWMQRLLSKFPGAVWLNPQPEPYWSYTPSIKIIQELMGERMFPMTLKGIDDAVRELKHKRH